MSTQTTHIPPNPDCPACQALVQRDRERREREARSERNFYRWVQGPLVTFMIGFLAYAAAEKVVEKWPVVDYFHLFAAIGMAGFTLFIAWDLFFRVWRRKA